MIVSSSVLVDMLKKDLIMLRKRQEIITVKERLKKFNLINQVLEPAASDRRMSEGPHVSGF